ncbi:oligosaccharide flippase family protein [Flavobacteriaceae bacterium]|nr:oligosaccharide flippase family protein [Flavobacteriaceae bacterium]
MNKKSKNIFIKNFTNLSLNQGINILIAIVATPILFQNLGDSQFGLVNLAFSIFMLISIVVSYGYHLNGPKQISLLNKLEKEADTIKDIVSLRIFIAIIISIVIIALIYLTDFFNGYELIILFSIPILFSEAIHPVFYLQGKNNLSVLAILNAFSKLFYLGLIILSIKNQNDAFKVNLLYGSVLSLVFLVYWGLFFYKNKLKFHFVDLDKIKFRLKENFQFFMSSVAGHISIHSGIIILKLFVNNSELGKFALANKIAFLLRMIPVFIVQSVLQNASIINQNNPLALKKYLNYYFKRGLILTFITGLFFTIFSKWIIIIFSGQEIIYSNQILSVLSFIPFLAMLNFKNILLILVNEKKEILNKATWISAFIMIPLAITLSYYYKGFGLAIALLISEFSSFIVHTILLSRSNVSK